MAKTSTQKPKRKYTRRANPKLAVIVPEVAPSKTTSQIDLIEREAAMRAVLKFVHSNQVNTIEELAEKTKIDIGLLREIQAESEMDYVKVSQFKDGFPIMLERSVRDLTKIINEITKSGASVNKVEKMNCDPFRLQKYVASLKTLKDILFSTENYNPAATGDLVARRTVRAAYFTEETFELFRKNQTA